MKQFGDYVGIAFQIKDDLFDYGQENVGKPTGNDIREKKLTLPLIYTINKIGRKKAQNIIYIIKNENENKAKVAEVIKAVIDNGGMQYATEKMYYFRDKALEILNEFPESQTRVALESLVRYTTDRKY